MYLGSNRVTVSPSLRYRLTARLKAATQNQQGALHAVEWGANNVQLRDTTLALSSGLNANWETLRGYLMTLAGTQSVEIRLMPVLPQGGGAQLSWDSVDLTKGDATAWEPWETTLASTLDYSPPVANPYKDLILTATFFRVNSTVTSCPALPASCTSPNCIQGYGFWDGVPGTSSSRTFKAVPCCRRVVGVGPSAVPGPRVNALPSPPNPAQHTIRYACGRAPQCDAGQQALCSRYAALSSGYRFLVYGDQTTTFPWVADTAWDGAGRLYVQLGPRSLSRPLELLPLGSSAPELHHDPHGSGTAISAASPPGRRPRIPRHDPL